MRRHRPFALTTTSAMNSVRRATFASAWIRGFAPTLIRLSALISELFVRGFCSQVADRISRTATTRPSHFHCFSRLYLEINPSDVILRSLVHYSLFTRTLPVLTPQGGPPSTCSEPILTTRL